MKLNLFCRAKIGGNYFNMKWRQENKLILRNVILIFSRRILSDNGTPKNTGFTKNTLFSMDNEVHQYILHGKKSISYLKYF